MYIVQLICIISSLNKILVCVLYLRAIVFVSNIYIYIHILLVFCTKMTASLCLSNMRGVRIGKEVNDLFAIVLTFKYTIHKLFPF